MPNGFRQRNDPRWARQLSILLPLVLVATLAVAQAPPPETEPDGGEGRAMAIRTAELRTGPFFGNKVIARISAGHRVAVIGHRGEWTHVRIGNDIGWMRSHVLATHPNEPARTTQPDDAADEAWIAELEATRLRSRDDVAHDERSSTPAAWDAATRTEDDLVDETDRAVDPVTGDLVPARALYLRAAAHFDAPLIGRVPPGHVVRLIAERDDWTEVSDKDGRTGWVRTLALFAPALGSPRPVPSRPPVLARATVP